jgi:valyl-tRNA synthetase
MQKDYDPDSVEEKWREKWLNEERYRQVYRFDREDAENTFIIDTPPPFTTGIPHMGHVMWWSLNDAIARYKRMKGFNVLLPQGWDCQGLPTEVKVEEEYGIDPSDTEQFLAKCQEYTEEMIDAMKQRMTKVGYMPDWRYEYRTMDDSYHRLVQKSLLRFVDRDLVYRKKFPTHWCPQCSTAIAKAEIDREDREAPLNYIDFHAAGSGDPIRIATTRPELIPACVAMAVNPDDDRYGDLVGVEVEVPLFDRTVPIIADEAVDPEFGTGVLMICTFGDEEDKEKVYGHDLEIIDAIDEHGRLKEVAGEYAGMPAEEAREAIIDDLKAEGYLDHQETTEQELSIHDRCDAPVEIIRTEQWFIDVMNKKDEILDAGGEVNWLPEYMESRFEEWTEDLKWDWCISRQRNFGTPLPFWSCADCGEILVPDEDELPLDPRTEPDHIEECPDCGGEAVPCEDVADCWVDSSVSALRLVEWEDFDGWRDLYPVELREQGHDIIRTWAFYSIFRCNELTGEKPWKDIYINGMVLDEDGKKMSKSRGNVVVPDDVLPEWGADSIRQGILMVSPGDDIPFSWKDIKHGTRFKTKFWNINRFANDRLEDFDIDDVDERDLELDVIDRWILTSLDDLIAEVSDLMDEYRFDAAIERLQNFIWKTVADNYVEIAKPRLYSNDPREKRAAQYTLYTVLHACTKLLAPIMPYITEEIYHSVFKEIDGSVSVHGTEWPSISDHVADVQAQEAGDQAVEVIGGLRKFKSDSNMPLNESLAHVTVFAVEGLDGQDAVVDAMHVEELEVQEREPEFEERIESIDLDYAELGPRFGEGVKQIEDAVSDPSGLAISEGVLRLTVDGETVELVEGDDFEAERTYGLSGREGELVQTENFAILVQA